MSFLGCGGELFCFLQAETAFTKNGQRTMPARPATNPKGYRHGQSGRPSTLDAREMMAMYCRDELGATTPAPPSGPGALPRQCRAGFSCSPTPLTSLQRPASLTGQLPRGGRPLSERAVPYCYGPARSESVKKRAERLSLSQTY